MTAAIITLTGIPQTAIDAFVYGAMGALAGALVTWLIGKHLFARPLADARHLITELEAAAREHTAALQAQTEQLARLAGPPQREEHP